MGFFSIFPVSNCTTNGPGYGPVMVRSIATKIGRCVLAGKHFEISCTQQIQLALQVAFSVFCNKLEQNSQSNTF